MSTPYKRRKPDFVIFVRRGNFASSSTPLALTTSQSTRAGSSSDGTSGSSYSSVESTLKQTCEYFDLSRKELEDIMGKSVQIRAMVNQDPTQKFIVLEPRADYGIETSSIDFMIRNLLLKEADYGGDVLIEDLVGQVNTLWYYKCNMLGFIHGWNHILSQDYKRCKRRNLLSDQSRDTTDRCWWEQPWGSKSSIPLSLLAICWVWGYDLGSIDCIFLSELITAIWDSEEYLPTCIHQLRTINECRRNERVSIFQDFQFLTLKTDDPHQTSRLKEIRNKVKDNLNIDFEYNVDGSQNYNVLSQHTPYALLRNIENLLIGQGTQQPHRTSHQRRGGSSGSEKYSQYPRDGPNINWRGAGSALMTGLKTAIDFEARAMKTEVKSLLLEIERRVKERQISLYLSWRDSSHGQIKSWQESLGMIVR